LGVFFGKQVGYPAWANKYAYNYPRKWEISMEHTLDFGIKGQSFLEVGYLRLAESFFLFSELFSTDFLTVWISGVNVWQIG